MVAEPPLSLMVTASELGSVEAARNGSVEALADGETAEGEPSHAGSAASRDRDRTRANSFLDRFINMLPSGPKWLVLL